MSGALKFENTPLVGLVLVEPVLREDERGLFCRTFCRDEFIAAGLPAEFAQSNTSFTKKRGTIRGMHLQIAGDDRQAEGKIVRCTRGAIFDVAVDIRRDSPTFGRWHAVELTAENRRGIYIPPGFAHGLQTLVDDSEAFYQITVPYSPELQRGVRWDDPTLDIAWPIGGPSLSDRDRNLPLLAEADLK